MREFNSALKIPDSLFALGCMYFFGMGIEQSYSEALYWFTKASYYDYADAQYNIGCMYDAGEDVPKDEQIAFKWFQKAANNGSVNAKYNLGVYYELGEGNSIPNISKAIELYKEAGTQGHQGAIDCLKRLGVWNNSNDSKQVKGGTVASFVKSIFKKNKPASDVDVAMVDDEQTVAKNDESGIWDYDEETR